MRYATYSSFHCRHHARHHVFGASKRRTSPNFPVTTHGFIWMAFSLLLPCLGGPLSHGACYHFCLFNKPVVAIQTIWQAEATEVQQISKLRACLALPKKASQIEPWLCSTLLAPSALSESATERSPRARGGSGDWFWPPTDSIPTHILDLNRWV